MANEKRLEPVVLENVRIMFRNFKGEKRQFNEAGQRNFAIFLDPPVADAMLADGFNIKWLKKREDDDSDEPPQAYISVKVNFSGGRPPRIVLVTSRGRTPLDEETAEMVDIADIKYSDVIINPSVWEVNGKTGVAAYLKSIYVIINEDELDEKYGDLDDLSFSKSPSEPRFTD